MSAVAMDPRATSSPVSLVLERVAGVRQLGLTYVAKCPAHDDHSDSLSISRGDEGHIRLHCSVGCGAADVLAAVGLELGGLYGQWGHSL
jgi:DNA primase